MGGGACNFLRARARRDGGWDGLLFGPPLTLGTLRTLRIPHYGSTSKLRRPIGSEIVKMNAFKCLRVVARPATSVSTLFRPSITRMATPQGYATPNTHHNYITNISKSIHALAIPRPLPPQPSPPHARPHILAFHTRSTRHIICARCLWRNARSGRQDLDTPGHGQHADSLRTERYIQSVAYCAEAETWVPEQD
jgi:hypothetical protein